MQSSSVPQINIIVPLYNEEEVYHKLIKRLSALLDTSPLAITVLMVDDGSKDGTAELMRATSQSDSRFKSIILSRNFGHQVALTAAFSKVDASEGVFIIDGDLQDPPELLADFYHFLQQGYDVVYAVRKKRKEAFYKRWAYQLFYKVQRKIVNIDIPLDSGDFSLVSRKVIDHMNQMTEESRFIRGMRAWIGFKQIGVEYNRDSREDGDSKYSLKALIALALNGIYNYSEFPVKVITRLGFATVGITLMYLITTIIKKLFFGAVIEGFTGLMITIILFGGVQLISLGILGEYILRIFFQVKKRPLFIIDEFVDKKKDDQTKP